MRYRILIIFILFVAGCVENSSDNSTNKSPASAQDDSKENMGVNTPEVGQNESLKLSIVNFDQVKSSYINNYTAGVLSEKKSDHFQSKAKDDFIGIYYFIGKESSLPYVGLAIVAVTNSEAQWDYNNDNERLLEFTVYSNEFNPFSSIIKIGESQETVIEIFGKDFKRLNSTLIYEQQAEEIVSFLIKENRVVAIRVGLYKDKSEVPPIELK